MKYKLLPLYTPDMDKLRDGTWSPPEGWRVVSFHQDDAYRCQSMLLEQVPVLTYRDPG